MLLYASSPLLPFHWNQSPPDRRVAAVALFLLVVFVMTVWRFRTRAER